MWLQSITPITPGNPLYSINFLLIPEYWFLEGKEISLSNKTSFAASVTRFIARLTDDWLNAICKSLPTLPWYDPVAKKRSAQRTYGKRKQNIDHHVINYS